MVYIYPPLIVTIQYNEDVYLMRVYNMQQALDLPGREGHVDIK